MKKHILIGFLGLALVMFLAGCGKEKQSSEIQLPETLPATEQGLRDNTISEEEDMEIKTDKPLEGNDEATKTINEIDQIISSDASLDKNSLSDSELGL